MRPKGTAGSSSLTFASMLPLILSLLDGAFPLRGSVVQSIDSNLVLDQDTLHATRVSGTLRAPG